jgi:hypothetical protein
MGPLSLELSAGKLSVPVFQALEFGLPQGSGVRARLPYHRDRESGSQLVQSVVRGPDRDPYSREGARHCEASEPLWGTYFASRRECRQLTGEAERW